MKKYLLTSFFSRSNGFFIAVIFLLSIYLFSADSVHAQTSCESTFPASCQFEKTTPHTISDFPCWTGNEPLFTNGKDIYNQITIDDTGHIGGGDCGGGSGWQCTNEVIFANPDPTLQVKGLWWRMHDHGGTLTYNLYACRTPLSNGTCTSTWELLVSDQGVNTSGDPGTETCSITNSSGQDTRNTPQHPPGNQGCPDPLPDPKLCHASAGRQNWPCAMSFDEHTWVSNSCSPQTITAFRITFAGGSFHAHLADAMWILQSPSCTIQGFKQPQANPTFAGQIVTLKNAQGTVLETKTDNPYFFLNLPANQTHTVTASGTNIVGSTLCMNATNCHGVANGTNPAFQAGNTRNVPVCPDNGANPRFADLWWHYATPTPSATTTPQPTNTPVPSATPQASPTPEPGYCTQDASITLSAPPAADAGTITLRVKFQGAFADNIIEAGNQQKVRVSIIKQIAEDGTGLGLQTISSKTFENITVTNTGEVDENGIAIYEGTFEPTAIVPGNNYSILVKGPYHLQRKFCENNPTEQAEEGFPYTCKKVGQITLSGNDNVLNFSGVLLQGGDLPGSQGQDGVVNTLDVSLVLGILDENGNSEDPADVTVADMDFNGVVNAKDRSNIIETLEEKYGDDEPI